jgi:transcriptional regulator with XRE-family HTH domain
MNNLKEKLTSLASDQTSDWKPGTRHRCENKEWLKKSADIGIFVLEALKAQNLSQKDLAEKLNVSPQQISEIVNGQENLTLETITNLEKALGIRIVISTLSRESISSMMKRNIKSPSFWLETFKKNPLLILIFLYDLYMLIYVIKCTISRFF